MADRSVFKNQVDLEGKTNAKGDFAAKKSLGCVPDGQNFGVYEAAFEVDFAGSTITTTDNGLVKTVATLPANCRIIEAYMLTSLAFNSADEKGVDLVVTSTSPSAADDAIADDVVQVITAVELKNNSSGALNSFSSANFGFLFYLFH